MEVLKADVKKLKKRAGRGFFKKIWFLGDAKSARALIHGYAKHEAREMATLSQLGFGSRLSCKRTGRATAFYDMANAFWRAPTNSLLQRGSKVVRPCDAALLKQHISDNIMVLKDES